MRPTAPHLKFNEGKACDAVVRVLEARAGQPRVDVQYPEKARHAVPIEMICKIDNVLFAFEHTGIEPFAGHLKLDAEAGKHVRPIEEMVAGKLPPADTFELHMPAGATQGMLLKDVRRIHDALVAWIIATAPTLLIARYAELLPTTQNVQPPGVPFAVSLFRFETIIPPSRFMVKHLVADIANARELRIQEACSRKFPKLDAWRRNGARTVLVLEENDIFLTNAQIVYETLARVEPAFSNRPDEIYLVSTVVDPWGVYALRVGNQGYYAMSQARNCLTQFDPNILDDLTGR
jgi:hypothetical protein